jgi:hypothetical protein
VTVAILAGSPAVAVALLTLRPTVWFEPSGAVLDERYVEPHLRGRGIGVTEPGSTERAPRRRPAADHLRGLAHGAVDAGPSIAGRWTSRVGTSAPVRRAVWRWKV